MVHRNVEKYDGGALKDVYKIVTCDKSSIYGNELETKQQSTIWAFENKSNPMKVVCGKKQFGANGRLFLRKTGHVATVPLEQRGSVNSRWYTTEFSHIDSNQRLFDRPKRHTCHYRECFNSN